MPSSIVRFYCTNTKKQAFRDELTALGPVAAAAVSEAITRFRRGEAFRHEVSPLGRRVRGHMLQEIRVSLAGQEYRVLFAEVGGDSHVMLCLTAINKKTKALPKAVVERAESRLADWVDRGRPA